MEKQKYQQNDIIKINDKFFATYILFYAFGTMSLIPSHFFPTATDYWMYKFRDVESNQSYNGKTRTELQAVFTADYSIVSHVGNAVFIILTILFIRKLAIHVRIITALSGILGIFIITCIFIKVDSDSWQVAFMVITLLTGCILTGFGGMFLVTLLEMAPKFPPRYLVVIFTGQAICGILSAVVQIISLSVKGGPELDGLVYFGSGLIFVFSTLVLFLISLKSSQFFKHHFRKEIQIEKIEVTKEKVLIILGKIKFYLAAMFITGGSTTMIYPAVTSLVMSVHKDNGAKWDDVYFNPVANFLIYSISDYIGRELGTILKKPRNPLILLGACIIRLVLVPMIMLCNAQPRSQLPVVFDSNFTYIIFIILFASTNGYFFSNCVIHITEIPTDEEKPLTMFFILIVMIGSMVAFSFVGTAMVKAL